MFEILDRRTSLSGNQVKILAAAIIGEDNSLIRDLKREDLELLLS